MLDPSNLEAEAGRSLTDLFIENSTVHGKYQPTHGSATPRSNSGDWFVKAGSLRRNSEVVPDLRFVPLAADMTTLIDMYRTVHGNDFLVCENSQGSCMTVTLRS